MTAPQTWIPTGGSTDIFAGTVYAGQIAAGAIGTAELAAGSIVADKIAAGAIGAVAIAAGVITADKIAAGAVSASQIAADAIVAGNIAAGAIGTEELAARAITADKIATGAITATEIAARSVTADRIVANAITAAEIAANTITADKLNVASVQAALVTAAAINALTITAAYITGGSISGVTLTGGTIRTAVGGKRIEISAADFDRINFYTGLGNEAVPGQLICGGAAYPYVQLVAPIVSGIGAVYVLLGSDNTMTLTAANITLQDNVYVAKKLSTGAWVNAGSSDGIWIQDRYNTTKRWKLAFNSSSLKLSVSDGTSTYSTAALT